ITKEFETVGGFAVNLPEGRLAGFTADGEVAAAAYDRPAYSLMDVTVPTVKADVARQSYGLDGSGIAIAVIDSGINDDHEDLRTTRSGQGGGGKSRVVYAENFVANEPTVKDLYGHGTHVAGIIAGDGSASTGNTSYRTMMGIAPQANLINLRVLDSKGVGSE